MECKHLRGNPRLQEHVLPCRHRLCLDCTRKRPGLMQGELFSCPICGNFSQYVDPLQTVEGRSGRNDGNQNVTIGNDSDHDYGAMEQRDLTKERGEATPSHNYLIPHPSGGDDESYDRAPDTSLGSIHEHSSETGYFAGRHMGAVGHHRGTSQQVGDVTLSENGSTLEDKAYERREESEGAARASKAERCSAWGTGSFAGGHAGTSGDHRGTSQQVASSESEVILEDQVAMMKVYEQQRESKGAARGTTAEGQEVDQSILCSQKELLQIARERSRKPANEVDMSRQHEPQVCFFCVQCDVTISAECRYTHLSHETYRIGDSQDPPQSGDHHDPLQTCVIHKLHFNMYCQNCKEMLCNSCYQNRTACRYLHRTLSIREAKKDLSTSFFDLTDQVREGMKIYEDEKERNERELNEIIQEAEDLKHIVDTETKRAHERLDSNADDMKERIEKRLAEVLEARNIHSEEIDSLRVRLSEAEKGIANAQNIKEYDLPSANLRADEIEASLRFLKRQSINPPRESFDLACRARGIPKSEDVSSPVRLISGSGRYLTR